MRRAIWGIAFIVLLAVATLAALPLFVSPDAVRAGIIEQTTRTAGLKMSFRDSPQIRYRPYLGVVVNSVVIEGAGAGTDHPPLVQMEQMRGQLDITSMLLGRVVVKRFELVRPQFNFQTDAEGGVNWILPDGRLWRSISQARQARQNQESGETTVLDGETDALLGAFEIVDGTATHVDERSGYNETITNINARIDWQDTSSPLTIAGNCIRGAEAIEYSIRADTPAAFLSGGTAPLSFVLKSGAFAASFKGNANRIADLHLTGKFSFSSPSVRRIGAFFGQDIAPGSTLSGVSGEGDLKGTIKQFQLSNAVIQLDGNQGRGVLQYSHSAKGPPLINGTLAVERLDLTPYVAAFHQEAELGKAGLPGMELLHLFDMDLRLSAARAAIGRIELADFAASIAVGDATATLNVGNAELQGGTLVGKLALSGGSEEATIVNAQAMYSGFDAAAISAALGAGPISMTGIGNAEIEVRSQGQSSKAVIENLWGLLQIATDRGSIEGIDFGALHHAAEGEASDSGDLAFSGRTPFDRLRAEIAFNRNSAWIRSMTLGNRHLSANVAGRSALDMSAIALSVTTHTPTDDAQANSSNSDDDAMQFFIGGSISQPLVTPIGAVSARP